MVFVPFLDFVQKIVSMSDRGHIYTLLPVGNSLGFDENIRRACRNGTELNVELNKQFGSVLTNNIDMDCMQSSLTNSPLP